MNKINKDIIILESLYKGWHLEPKELERAKDLLYMLNRCLNERVV